MYFSSNALLVAGGLATAAQAHMLLRTPAPYSSPALTNGPLLVDGSNFPCQSTGGSFVGTATKMAKGTTQKMGFTGQAVHGGGSCQISITYDTQPNKQSSFKVIHSIQGGCPARGVSGNAGSNANAAAPDEYEFEIPADIPNGKATLAWSWLNKVGNREFYMNCAPVEISGPEGNQAALAALPDMLVANIAPGGTCATKEGVDTQYPNPGSSVENTAGSAFGPPVGDCGATVSGNSTASTGASSGSGTGAGSSAVSSAASSAVSSAAQAAATPAASTPAAAAASPAAASTSIPAVRGRIAHFRA